jgi:hypothetical protein
MKKSASISLFIAALVGAGLFATSVTAATPVYKQQVRGHSAYGWAYEYDGCESTSVDIGGSESTAYGGGAPVQDNSAYAGLYSYNWCTGEETYGWAWVPGGFSGDIDFASIDLAFEADSYELAEVDGEWVYNYLGTRTVEINAEFTGVGQISHGMNNSTSHWGSSFTHYRSAGQWREATLDVSVTVDGASIDLSNAAASLGNSNTGSLELYH